MSETPDKFQLSRRCFYFRDGPTIGFPGVDIDGKHWFGERRDRLFDSEAEAWEWAGIDPANLPEDEVVEGDRPDDQFTRHYERVYPASVKVTDIPLSEFTASSRITERFYTVRQVSGDES